MLVERLHSRSVETLLQDKYAAIDVDYVRDMLFQVCMWWGMGDG